MTRVIYHPAYNYGIWGAQWLHPFDQSKSARIWKRLRSLCGASLGSALVRPERPAGEQELLLVHSQQHLQSLKRPTVMAAALEIPLLSYFPAWVSDRLILRPMRWQTMGSLVAAREALSCGLAVNLGGGFHHAHRDLAHGFSVYNDIATLILALRGEGKLQQDDRVAYIDLDAHHGDGVAAIFANDPRVFLLDMYNAAIFPGDGQTGDRVDCRVRLHSGITGREYVELLRQKLPGFLESVARGGQLKLAVYNAGTDVYERDPLGLLRLSEQDILERDLFVLGELQARAIPAVMLLSGGYTQESYRLVANTAVRIVQSPNGFR
ncbi:MAG TPA: histone deacetylase [Pirellulaceae bacterium]|nr:histone deacetylase [Pirellulaceae bacterium]